MKFKKSFGAVQALVLIAVSAVSVAAQSTAGPLITNVLLVHGAWADGSSWAKVIPLLEAKGLHVVAVQIPLTSFADDVAATQRAVARQSGPVLLVGHSYGGAVITEAGNSSAVAGLVYVAAFAPDSGQNIGSESAPFPPAPGSSQLQLDNAGFLTLTPTGIWQDFAPDLNSVEKLILTATQGPTAASGFATDITSAAWRSKPSWYIVANNDRMISPDLERAAAAAMNAKTIALDSSHVPMLSEPGKVAAFIEQAASEAKATH